MESAPAFFCCFADIDLPCRFPDKKLVHASHRTVVIVEIQPYIQCIFVWLTKIITQLYIIGGVAVLEHEATLLLARLVAPVDAHLVAAW